jgi:hypothetical protein
VTPTGSEVLAQLITTLATVVGVALGAYLLWVAPARRRRMMADSRGGELENEAVVSEALVRAKVRGVALTEGRLLLTATRLAFSDMTKQHVVLSLDKVQIESVKNEGAEMEVEYRDGGGKLKLAIFNLPAELDGVRNSASAQEFQDAVNRWRSA